MRIKRTKKSRGTNEKGSAPAPGAVRRASRRTSAAWQVVTIALLVAFSLVVSLAIADQQANSTMKGFKAPLEYFEPPHELQVKSYLEGSDAENEPNGIIAIRDAKLKTFHDDGTIEMIAIAPHCVYDTREQTVSSAGPLQVQTSESGLSIWHQGVGFLWVQTNADLRISNEVSTVITGTATNLFKP
jgi:hypothetical protein